jgi:hypothetical protein
MAGFKTPSSAGGGAVPIGFDDDVALNLGTSNDVSILYETADANANRMIIALPDGGVVNVPVLVIGDQSLINKDLGLFNGVTVPTIAIFDATETNRLVLDGTPAIKSNTSIILQPSGDTDDYFTFATASNIPTIYGTGSYLRIGDAGATGHSLASEDDLMVSGKLEVTGLAYFDGAMNNLGHIYNLASGMKMIFGGLFTNLFRGFLVNSSADDNALTINYSFYSTNASYVPVLPFLVSNTGEINFGLFDGVTQPLIPIIEKGNLLHSATDGIADAGGASAILKHIGGFTNAVVSDIVRITAGTNCTAGWYWITTVTSADQVTLDRNYTSGDTTNVTFVTFHNFPMIGADGVCLKCFDGAPGDGNVEIDRDGWLQLDVGQANGRLYWRANNAWHYVDATAGISLPANERVDVNGHLFQIGDEVRFKVDRINDDGSFHALPIYLN